LFLIVSTASKLIFLQEYARYLQQAVKQMRSEIGKLLVEVQLKNNFKP